ncbi:rCG52434 [Rattus norvegicus]|uniref:RCG52434 n=1 Tax=Rattus norvegicus TaxID=10116 RepID=A6K102_RAT|nr:rCG52434 [Rattus norvegicus]
MERRWPWPHCCEETGDHKGGLSKELLHWSISSSKDISLDSSDGFAISGQSSKGAILCKWLKEPPTINQIP